jgi:O-antigen ligase
MNFIPSHPHNFFIELLLETGLAGTLSFLIFIIILNYKILKTANSYQKNFLIFFNGYFWGASLVNFSYWQAWWQCSYFLILSFITAHIFHNSSKVLK